MPEITTSRFVKNTDSLFILAVFALGARNLHIQPPVPTLRWDPRYLPVNVNVPYA
jgi:hypothetical protein